MSSSSCGFGLGEKVNIFMGSQKAVVGVTEMDALLPFEVVGVESVTNTSLTSNGGRGVVCRSVGEHRMYCANNFGDTRGITGECVLKEALQDGGMLPFYRMHPVCIPCIFLPSAQ